MNIVIMVSDDARIDQANELAKQTGFPIVTDALADDFVLDFERKGLSCHSQHGGQLMRYRVDFLSAEHQYRQSKGGGKNQDIAKACGLKKRPQATILDVNAGFGGDAFVLASLGCTVTMLERSPVVHALLADGLARLSQSTQANTVNMTLLAGDAVNYMQTTEQRFDVVYCDPMYPHKRNSALVKKEMRLIRLAVGDDDDADELLKNALKIADYRVVVKRPKGAPALLNITPDIVYQGASTRFDVYQL